MAGGASELTLLLPERRRFTGQAVARDIGKILGRADVLFRAEGERNQLLRHFDILPKGEWPMAAIGRQADAGDAGDNTWLRADPCHVRPDISGVRLLAWGNLGITAEDAEDFLQPLRQLFGDIGLEISAPEPERWYLKLPPEASFPAFSLPSEGLGEDLLAHLPQGPEAQRWRVLITEAQVILHNHPRNTTRIAAGLPAVNSLWFWGGGTLPQSVHCKAAAVVGDEHELRALAALAGSRNCPADDGSTLIDLRQHREWARLERGEVGEALRGWRQRYDSLTLDFADGAAFKIAAGQSWRLLRRPLERFE